MPEWDVEEEFCHLDKLGKAFQTENKSQREEARAEAGWSGRRQNQVIKEKTHLLSKQTPSREPRGGTEGVRQAVVGLFFRKTFLL